MKEFNTTAVCIPSRHYMVDLTERVEEIRKMVDAGKYFTINRARQYGKSTTLTALKNGLAGDYTVLSLDFQGIGNAGFSSEEIFVQEFCRLLLNQRRLKGCIPEKILENIRKWKESEKPDVRLGDLFDTLTEWCEQSDKGIVLIVDEVDSAANNQVFLDFLSQLRDGYIARDTDDQPAFQSVILAGVTDIKHLRSRIREEDLHKMNSPWNVAADFDIDMSLSEPGIKGMLDDYEADHHTGMDTAVIAKMIREYTNGYPFLVSRICLLIDRDVVRKLGSLAEAWTNNGVEEAVKILLTEKNSLFDSLISKLRNYDILRKQLRRILLTGESIEYLPDNIAQDQLQMYGFIVNDHNTVAVSNRIFEMRLYKYYIGESRFSSELRGDAIDNKPSFIKGGNLDIPLIMERFIETQRQIRNIDDEAAEKRFIEEDGREKFLTYISPIINGVGTYSVEDRTRNRRRMDLVIHYNGKRYIVELKIWRGERYNADGEKQISEYLDYFNLTTGYMLSFNFNKKKEPGVTVVNVGGKTLYEGTV